ncbi:hypothetical protein [Klebsiella pneumoniae]|uniref:hypothetical protein n=1 Tax=Klebsiella pneumoniae TaxID=573 RepID=UPI0030CFD8A4
MNMMISYQELVRTFPIIPASASGPEVINAESTIQPAMTNGIAPLSSQTRKALDAAKLAETKADILKIW